jgi:cytosine/uracil/thiamine/allantoin permease
MKSTRDRSSIPCGISIGLAVVTSILFRIGLGPLAWIIIILGAVVVGIFAATRSRK